MTGMEFLRNMVRAFDGCREDVLDRFTVEELIAIRRAWLASGWEFYPDQWSDAQIDAALRGIPPKWDDNEQPIEEDR